MGTVKQVRCLKKSRFGCGARCSGGVPAWRWSGLQDRVASRNLCGIDSFSTSKRWHWRLPVCCSWLLLAAGALCAGGGAVAPGASHWAWQPLAASAPGTGVDAHVEARLRENGLALSPEAERRVLIRRLTFDLHGLPPAAEEVDAFVGDPDPDAYERLVDRLLASPHYGERFARHWLDLAHYADTHGFERDMRRPHAWRYRDYVINAFNADKPFPRFLQEQIAGDVLWPGDGEAVVATGFLAAGPWDFVGQVEAKGPELRRAARSLDLDDMAMQVMTATLATTINCARCHDHKLDPIRQEEYYQLRAVFAGTGRGDREVPNRELGALTAARAEVDAEIRRLAPGLDLAELVAGGADAGTAAGPDTGAALRPGIDPRSGKPEQAALGYLDQVQPNQFVGVQMRGIDGVFIPRGDNGEAMIPVTSTGLTITGISGADGNAWDCIRGGPVNSQHSSELDGVTFGAGAESLLGLHANAGITFDLAEARQSLGREELQFTANVGYFGHRDAAAFADVRVLVDGKKVVEHLQLKRADGLRGITVALPRPARFLTLMATDGGNGISMDQVGFGKPTLAPSPVELPPEEAARLQSLRNRRQALDSEIAALAEARVYAVVGVPEMPETRILKRGDPESPVGEPLSPQALALLPMLEGGLGGHAASEGERRAALARWITDPRNPLMPRVLVNRLWHWHFGRGLVDTPSDFGLGGGLPSHPALLDWLAGEFQRQGGSLKALHRIILNSATYKQDSRHAPDDAAVGIDADNRLLWRQNPRRIEAEAVRDAVLRVSGKLNLERGGPGYEDFNYTEAYAPEYAYITADRPALWRRSIYRFVVRTTPNRFLSTLDCPDPANVTPVRSATTTPLQALTLYNNAFMLQQAGHFAGRVEREAGSQPEAQVRRAFELAFARAPEAGEAQPGAEFISAHGLPAFCRALLNTNEFVHVD